MCQDSDLLGMKSYLLRISLQGGGLCNDIPSCSERANSSLGSSLYMGKAIAFSGILSDQRSQNPGIPSLDFNAM
jgi:hypothetical protein